MSTTVNTTVKSNEMTFTFKITSVNEAAKKCNFTLIIDRPDMKIPQVKQYRNAKISGLVLWKIANKPEIISVGESYTSTRLSDNWIDGPLQLIEWIDKDGDVISMLRCVEERNARVIDTVDPFGNPVRDYIERFHSKKYYNRYRASKALIQARREQAKKMQTA